MRRAADAPVLQTTVAPEWIDYNSHMNDAAYARVFSLACDALMDAIGLDDSTRRASGRTIYTLQVMLHYFHEAKLGEAIAVSARVLERDAKRLRIWMEMTRASDGERLAASEQLLLSVDSSGPSPRAAAWSDAVAGALERMAAEGEGIDAPPEAGRGITLRRGKG